MLKRLTAFIDQVLAKPGSPTPTSKFVDLAPTATADKDGVYSEALHFATTNSRVTNIALTGPYGSGKSSIIQTFLTRYTRPYLQISLAAFLSDTTDNGGKLSKQEIERSILQQMLYGADSNRLPLSRFKRIQTPSRWSPLKTLYITGGAAALYGLASDAESYVPGAYFANWSLSDLSKLGLIALATSFAWSLVHQIYIASFGISLKSVSLKDIELEPVAVGQDSILNRHLDEIIYFFQCTKYDLVVIEDLDRFDKPDVFTTLREINSLVNANAGVNRTIRFLYALRDDIFVNTERTKFFEMIIPVIPIINSSNSIDKLLEQGVRLSLDGRLNRQFLREVSRYLDDLRLIQNIFNEYAVYAASLETGSEEVYDPNKLLAVLIYKNVLPRDFEELHRGKGLLASILSRRDEYVTRCEASYSASIAEIESNLADVDRLVPKNLQELRRIYASALLAKVPDTYCYVGLEHHERISFQQLADSERFEAILRASQIICWTAQNYQQNLNITGVEAEVDKARAYKDRKQEIEDSGVVQRKVAEDRIRQLRSKAMALRLAPFYVIAREIAEQDPELFVDYGENSNLARFLILEGFLDDSYYLYTSLFHEGRLSPNDNKFLVQIRGFVTPDPAFQIDNPKEVVAAMRPDDFGRSYVLNVKLMDCLLGSGPGYESHVQKFIELAQNELQSCESFLLAYYNRGSQVNLLLRKLLVAWPGFVDAALGLPSGPHHAAQMMRHLESDELSRVVERHPALRAYVAEHLPQILGLGIDFPADRLSAMMVEVSDLAALEAYPGITSVLLEHGLYRLKLSNLEFIFVSMLESPSSDSLSTQNYTAVRASNNKALLARVENSFPEYVANILLPLATNKNESLDAIVSVISHTEIDLEDRKSFLLNQEARLPLLSDAPVELHSILFESDRIEATWENCLSFFSGEAWDPAVLTDYLNRPYARSSLSQSPVPVDDAAAKLRAFIVGNSALEDAAYADYVRVLPRPFKAVPSGLSVDKVRILIEAQRLIFSKEALSSLDDDRLKVLFVEQNVTDYLALEDRSVITDEVRELILKGRLPGVQKVRIIREMTLDSLSGMPERAGLIGDVLSRSEAPVWELPMDVIVAMIQNVGSAESKIRLMCRFQDRIDDSTIRQILAAMPRPYCEIKTGYGIPRLANSEVHLNLVKLLKHRDLISSWKQGGVFDTDIRVNLFRK